MVDVLQWNLIVFSLAPLKRTIIELFVRCHLNAEPSLHSRMTLNGKILFGGHTHAHALSMPADWAALARGFDYPSRRDEKRPSEREAPLILAVAVAVVAVQLKLGQREDARY